MSDLAIRVMEADDIAEVIDWAATEGWNPGLSDAAAFRRADPDGFLVAVEGARPVAAISVVRYDAAYAFLGLYIVRPDRRGRGIGRALWRAGMAQAGARTVGLDGVLAQQENYARSGFSLAHRNIRFVGDVAVSKPAADPALRSIAPVDLADIEALDQRCFGARRPAFLQAWIGLDGHRALMLEGADGQARAYGVSRPCRKGFKIGPLFANGPEAADAIFEGLVAAMPPGETVILDVPEPNGAGLALAERHGLSAVFETARMYRGPAPALPLDAIFGLTTFELG